MRNNLTSAILLLLALTTAPRLGSAQEFDTWFHDRTFRFDYHHGGDATSETISADVLAREGSWAGSRKHLTDFPPYGKYRYTIVDAKAGTVLFEQGYSTLFGEWQTTDEARRTSRVFHETVRFPEPKMPFVIRIAARDAKGRFKTVYKEQFDPTAHTVRTQPALACQVIDLHTPAPASNCLDVVIVADGYSAAQEAKARADLHRYTAVLLETPPFSRFAQSICVRGVLAAAQAGGPDEPRKAVFNGPPAGTTFNTFDSPRYLTTLDNDALRDLAGQVPYDTIFVMVNSSRYGGAGIYNFFSIFVSDNEYDEYVFIHEFGHGFAGLGDEYYTSSVAYSDFYPRGVEPWEPNVTAALEGPEKVKWKHLLTPDVPLPTPEEKQFAGMCGVFEGAGYSAKGLYRPALDCKMMSKKRLDFCPVCMAATEAMIGFYVE